MRRALCLILAAATVTGAATACVGPTPIPTLPPQPTATPVFGSEEEALAAATAAYEEYLRVADEVGQRGWADAEGDLGTVVVDPLLSEELETGASFELEGYTQSGQSTFDSVALQSAELYGDPQVIFYVCLDVSDVDVLGPDGQSVVPGGRPDRLPLEVEALGAPPMKIARSELWSGSDFC